jgi:hypothetical protein
MLARLTFVLPATLVLAFCGILSGDPSPASTVMHPDRVAAAVAGARVRLVTAVESALRDVEGSRLISATLQPEGEAPAYAIRLLTEEGVKHTSIDAKSGVMTSPGDVAPAIASSDSLAAMRTAMDSARISPIQALEAAVDRLKGAEPIAIEFSLEGSHPVYHVQLLAGKSLAAMTLDGLTAQPFAAQQEPGQPAAPATADAKPKAAAEPTVWNFDKDEPGKTPAGWKFGETGSSEAAGKWQVVKDDAAISKPHVFSLVAGAGADAAYSVAMVEKSSVRDVELSVRVRANAGKVDQGGGLVWRCKDANNYYVCRFNPLESNYRVYKVVDGTRTQLASVKIETTKDKWYTVRASMKGADIVCWLDDQKLLEAKDESLPDAGMIGLWTKADALTSFDDLTLAAP